MILRIQSTVVFATVGWLVVGCQAFSRLMLLRRGRMMSFRAEGTGLFATALDSKKDAAMALEQAFSDGEKFLVGKSCLDSKLEWDMTNIAGNATAVHPKDLIPNAPHLTFQKFVTMQEKRVVVTFRFTELPYLRPYFLTFASKLKKHHSDIIIEKRTLPVVDANAQPVFEVIVDGKTVMGGGSSNSRERHVLGGRVDVQNTQSVYVSMEQIGVAITKARKKRRPTTLYGEDGEDVDDADTRIRRWHRSYVLRSEIQNAAEE